MLNQFLNKGQQIRLHQETIVNALDMAPRPAHIGGIEWSQRVGGALIFIKSLTDEKESEVESDEQNKPE